MLKVIPRQGLPAAPRLAGSCGGMKMYGLNPDKHLSLLLLKQQINYNLNAMQRIRTTVSISEMAKPHEHSEWGLQIAQIKIAPLGAISFQLLYYVP